MTIELKVHSVQKRPPLEIYVEKLGTIPLLEYSETCAKLCRILVYVNRFIKKCRAKDRAKCTKTIQLWRLRQLNQRPTIDEKREAMKIIIRDQQKRSYAIEYEFLQEHGKDVQYTKFPENSKIIAFRPFMDSDGIIRVGNRAKHSSLKYDAKHPIIVENGTRLCQLIVNEAHYATGHGAVQVMMQYIRQNYHVPRLRATLRAYLHKCVICARHAKQVAQQLMADLPIDRVNQNRAFLITGVDYAGPIKLIEKYKSVSSTRKCWIAVFVCMVTRAVHLDVVTNQTSMAFIMCFERFIARRGHCNRLYSDNGTNFRGAYTEIRRAFKEWHRPSVKDHINKKGTDWIFMKPSASHQGGIYEAAVKSMKYHLYRMLGAVQYTYEHLVTFLAKIEAILNSRPLYALSDDAMDLQAITPGHFLINEPLIMPPSIAAPEKTENPIKYMRDEQERMLKNIWKVWQKEYLSSLMQRKKWVIEKEPVSIGQMVVIYDENLPPAKWLLGKIVKLLPSKDGIVRAVKIRTPTNHLVRPIQKLCILPLEPCPDVEKKKQSAKSTKSIDTPKSIEKQIESHKMCTRAKTNRMQCDTEK